MALPKAENGRWRLTILLPGLASEDILPDAEPQVREGMCVKVKAALLPLGNQARAVVGTSKRLPGTAGDMAPSHTKRSWKPTAQWERNAS